MPASPRPRPSPILTTRTPLGLLAPLAVALLSAAAAAQTRTLATTHPEEFGQFGTVLAQVPDTDGDAKPDILVGAYNETVQDHPNAGRAYLFSGATGNLLRVFISPKVQTLAWFGGSVAGVPDADGDGRGDILIGAFNDGNTGPISPDGPGRAYLFSGATGKYLRTLNSPNPDPAGFFGFTVAGLGDITGDGCGDLAIGALTENPGAAPKDCGRVYLFNGATGFLLRTIASPNQQIAGGFGSSLAQITDLTGDGKPDLIVGAMFEQPAGLLAAGRAYLVNSATGIAFRTLVSPHAETEGNFGRSAAAVPDTNGDGKPDIMVGAPDEDPGASPANSGRAYLFSGATGGLLRSFAPGAPQPDGEFGYSVAGIPDLNADGRGDLAIGAVGMVGNGSAWGGRVFEFSGKDGAFLRTVLSPGQGSGQGFGTCIIGLPDLNGNGRGELAAGSPDENTPFVDAVGRAYLFWN